MNKLILFTLMTLAAATEFNIGQPFDITFSTVRLNIPNVQLQQTYTDYGEYTASYTDPDYYKIVTNENTWSVVYTGQAAGCTFDPSLGVSTIVETSHTLLTASMGESATYADTVHDGYMDSGCTLEILPTVPPPTGLALSAVPITPISMCDLLDGANYINAQCCSC